MADLAALRAAAADLDYRLCEALEQLAEDRLNLTQAQADRADRLVQDELMLGRIALERIEEAARS
jgi:hypothetical protein